MAAPSTHVRLATPSWNLPTSDRWQDLLESPSSQHQNPTTVVPSSADSSDDETASNHSDQLDPETGFDPFAAAARRARQQSSDVNLTFNDDVNRTPGRSHHYTPPTSDESPSPPTAKQLESQKWSDMQRFWSSVVDDAMFRPVSSSTNQVFLDLVSKKIDAISPCIADLSHFVAIPPPRYDVPDPKPQPSTLVHSKTGGLVRHESYLAPFSSNQQNDTSLIKARSFARSQSALLPFSRAKSFARAQSSMSALSSRSGGSYNESPNRCRDPRDRQATLSIFLNNNALTKLPSAFFQLQNLRVLSLRFNRLKQLPAAIGDLHNLSELHIANNELSYLPAEFLRLKLNVFTWFPNPFIKPSKDAKITVRPVLALKVKHQRQRTLDRLDEVQETTPMKIHPTQDASIPEPPPLTRLTVSRPRVLDRTRSEAQVEGYLARGIDQISVNAVQPIQEMETEQEDQDSTFGAANGSASGEEHRSRILGAVFEGNDSDDGKSSNGFITADANWLRGKVEGRSRVLATKKTGQLPSLQELCLRRLLSPYDTAEGEAHGLVSPFMSPSISSIRSRGGRKKRSDSRRNSHAGTPLWQSRANSFSSFSHRSLSFSSSTGSESGRLSRRIPTLLEAYENGTLQSLVPDMNRQLITTLEAARRSAASDWGTKARMRKSASSRKNALSAVPSRPATWTSKTGRATTEGEAEEYDIFGDVDAPGSLDRGDDACLNAWFSRCPNPKHLDEVHRSSFAASFESGRPLTLHRNLGSTSSVSSLGTTLGTGNRHSGATSSVDEEGEDGRHSPISQASSVGTVGAFGVHSSSTMPPPLQQMQTTPQNSQSFSAAGRRAVGAARFERGSSFARSSSSTSSSLATTNNMAGFHAPNRTQSANFVRGMSTASAFSQRTSSFAFHRSSSFAQTVDGNEDASVVRDWPLEEQDHRLAPVFSNPVETRLEWVSHIGGVKNAHVLDVDIDLDHPETETEDAPRTRSSTISADDRNLIPVLWRGCSHGCLDFLS